ncbi:hypothetical protein FHQ08_11560 [Lactobacillus sp. CC-MHH1034]|uniref:hypothetical protein n=1 Tax=Agrilactobacillus fermenti TaxID=2586909 RepID=UPI001E31FFD2|nr:hypothetical protein [Agrilactobacillus fermenti]MCD2257324.1 hypothetical protein [Agrilactobacillus fermenti]
MRSKLFAPSRFLLGLLNHNMPVLGVSLVWVAIVALSFTTGPQWFAPSLISLATFLFIGQALVAYSMNHKFDDQLQSLFWLRTKHYSNLIFTKWLADLTVGLLLAGFAVIFALVRQFSSNGQFFGNTFSSKALLYAIGVYLLCLLLGTALGSLFQRAKLISVRISAGIMLVLALFGTISAYIQQSYPWFKYISWLLPTIGTHLTEMTASKRLV